MCAYEWLEVICPCNKGSNCCMNTRSAKVIMNNRIRHATGRFIPIKESGERCQYRRRNAKGGWSDPDCKYSEGKEVVGSQMSRTVCFWCALDCESAPVDDREVYEGVDVHDRDGL
ncbi:hypothetical protein LIA77_07915 [Sarocladium implicatum]|nr:hypothetical protein LIA77_07915 [Sarocladium implicatum]